MVTIPSEAAPDPALDHYLLTAEIDVTRFNCAHDNPVACAARATICAVRRAN
jgi:hypothetical protein